jgi:hypothetical protein
MKARVITGLKWFLGIVLSLFLLISGGLYFFKDEIIGYVVKEVNRHLNAKVAVKEVDLTFWSTFPYVSVDFNEVFIQDALAGANSTDTLLYSEQIRLKFNAKDVWNEQYSVKSIAIAPGKLNIRINEKGENNYSIFKESEDSTTSNVAFQLQQVDLTNVAVNYSNEATSQVYETAVEELSLQGDFTSASFVLHAASRLYVKAAKSGQVNLLSDKQLAFDIDLNVDNTKDEIAIPNARVFVSNLPFELSGKVTPDTLDFAFQAKDIQLVDLVNQFSLDEVEDVKRFEGKGNVQFDLRLNGTNSATDPVQIQCDFGIQKGEITEPERKLKLRNISLKGTYSNKGGADKEYLKLNGVRFQTIGGPFAGNLLLTHFDQPRFQGQARGALNLKMLHALFHLPHIEQVGGNIGLFADFDVQTEVQPNESLDYTIKQCEGELELREVSVKLEGDKRTFKNANGLFYLRNDEAGIHDVRVTINRTDLRLNGVFRNIVGYFKRNGNLNADVDIRSRNIDVQDLGTSTKEEKIQDGRSFVLPENIDARVYLNVGQLSYENHEFQELEGNMNYAKRRFYFPSLRLKTAGAQVNADLTIEERAPEIFHISTHAASDNIQFKSLFREWNNFQQEAINENNVFGKAQAKVAFEAPFDLRSGVISKSIIAQVYLKITDGRLKNVDAFKSITESLKTTASAKLIIGKENIAGLERKLLDLSFETLENTFTIRNGRLEIPLMTIQSNALDVEASGTHTFDNRVDYRLAFRFRDLKERQASEFGQEIDDGTGMRVYLRMTGPMDNPTIIWDKASRKEQAKENREAEAANVRSMLKSEFGLFKNDTSVKQYQPVSKPKEEIIIEFGGNNTTSQPKKQETIPQSKPQKDTKIKSKLNTWKQQSEQEKKEEVEFD